MTLEGGVRQMARPKDKVMHNLTIRFSDEELEWLQSMAKKEVRPVAQLVRWIIAEYRKELAKKSVHPQA